MTADIVTCGFCGDEADEVSRILVIAANHSAEIVVTLAAGLRITTESTNWQRMEPDFILPSLPAPGRQQRRKRVWGMR